MKKILIWILVLFLLFSIVAGSPDFITNNILYMSMDNNTVIGTKVVDLINNYNGTNSGALTNKTGIINSSFLFDGSNDEVSLGDVDQTDGATQLTVRLWINFESFADFKGITQKYLDNNNRWGMSLSGNGLGGNKSILLNLAHTANTYAYSTGGSFNNHSWFHLVMVFNGSGSTDAEKLKFYINGAEEALTFVGPIPTSTDSNAADVVYGRGNSNTFVNAFIDEYTIWERALNASDILADYNGGAPDGSNQYPYTSVTPPVVVTNDTVYLEQHVGFTQNTPVAINSAIYSNVLSGNFDSNSTNAYVAFSTTLVPTFTGVGMICRVLIDGVDYDTEITRTGGLAGSYANAYMISSNFTLSSGSHSLNLQCKKSGAGGFIVDNAAGIVHLLRSNGFNLSFASANSTLTFENDSFFRIATFNYPVTNYSEINGSSGINLVIDSKVQYDYASTGNISAYIIVNGTPAGQIPRYGVIGTSGSAGAVFAINNVTNGQNVSLEVWVRGNGTIIGSFFIKEFVSPNDMVNHSLLNSSLEVSSNEFISLKNLTINNTGFAEGDIILKASIPIIHNMTNSEFKFRFNVDGSVGENFTRTVVTPNSPGVLTIQSDIRVSSGIHNVALEGLTSNNTGYIIGGSMIAYLASPIEFTPTQFNITAHNIFNRSMLMDFNVSVNGAVFADVNGVATIPTFEDFINFTINAENYFSTSFINHNSSLNVNQSMNQSRISIFPVKIFSRTNLTNFTFINSFYNDSVIATSMNVPFNIGNTSFVLQSPAYRNNSHLAQVSALEISSVVYNMTDSRMNITLVNGVSGQRITNFTVVAVDILTNGSVTNSTSTGEAFLWLEKDRNYTFNISGPGIATADFLRESNASLQNLQMEVFSFNSIRVNIFYFVNETPVLQNVTVTLIGAATNFSFVNVTNTGFMNLELLFPENYEIRFESANLNPISKFVTVLNDSTQEINVYMTFNTTTELQQIQVLDSSNQPVEGAIVWLQQEKVTNGTLQWLTIQEVETNSDGKTAVFVERDVTIFYRFVVIVEGSAVPILPSGNLFTTKTAFLPGLTELVQLIVNLEVTEQDFLIDRNAIIGNITFNESTNTFTYEFVDGRNTIYGGRMIVKVKQFNSSLQYTEVSNQVVAGSFGTISFAITPINNTEYVAEAFAIFNLGGNEELVDVATKMYTSPDSPLEQAVGVFITALVTAFIALLTARFGPLKSSFAVLIVQYFFIKFAFISWGFGIVNSLIALAIILFFRPRESK